MCPGVRHKERRRSACPSGFREGCGVLELMEHPLSSPSPPATATEKHGPISPRCELRAKQNWIPTVRDQATVCSFLWARISAFVTYSHTHTTFLSFREHIDTRLSIFSSVQEIWSEQVAACKLKCGAPRSPSILLHMIDSLLFFFPLSSSAPCLFLFVCLQIFGATIMGFGLWILLDNQSLIAVLRKCLHKMCATKKKT